MIVVSSPRRYYLGKRLQAVLDEQWAIASAWGLKQESEPGTALPVDFVEVTALSEAGYTTKEDLDGATVAELVWSVGLSSEQATNVLSAASAL